MTMASRSTWSIFMVLSFLFMSSYVLYVSTKEKTLSPEHPGLSFSVDFGDPVALRMASPAHYAIDTAEGTEEWSKLLPPSGHLVYISDPFSPASPPKAYTVTLFHQLKCLDVIRREFIAHTSEPPSKMLEHCMNYIRQTILCSTNLWLESANNVLGSASRTYDIVCRDWEAVYEAAARNHEETIKSGIANTNPTDDRM